MTSEEEADHCADSAFPYLHYRRQHADCQARSALLCGIPKNFFCRPKSRLYLSRHRRLTRRFLSHSVVFRRFCASFNISRFSVILWPSQCIFRAFWCFKMHISAFLELPVFSSKPRTRLMHLIIQFYYSQMPFVCQ